MKRYVSLPTITALFAGLVLTGCNLTDSNGNKEDNSSAVNEEVTLSAQLNSTNEVPDVVVASDGTGSGTLVVDTASGTLGGSVILDGLTGEVAAVHIHQGPAGVAGGVVVTLEQDADYPEQWNIPADTQLIGTDVELLLQGGFYLNAHTAANAAGEVRGQILPEGMEVSRFELSGRNEVPAVDSTASGTGFVTIDHQDKTLVVKANVSDLVDGSAAHIHSAFAGTNGGVVSALSASFTDGFLETDSALELTDEQYDALVQGGLYVNVHSAIHPAGELRGQVTPENIVVARAELSGDNEVPPVDTSASGAGYATVNTQTGALVMHLVTADLTAPASAAHLHHGPAGENGPVLIGLVQDGSDANLWSQTEETLSAEQIELLLGGELYFNVHTSTFPTGEVRGQIEP